MTDPYRAPELGPDPTTGRRGELSGITAYDVPVERLENGVVRVAIDAANEVYLRLDPRARYPFAIVGDAAEFSVDEALVLAGGLTALLRELDR